jgi:hypothetical protein
MRREYVRLAMAEMQSDVPWIIDDMANTMQKTYGGMPNSEFIVSPEGILLESRDWANPDELKAYLEEHVGPSGISDEEWKKFGERDRTAMSIGKNDEVPATEVPRISLHPLSVERIGSQSSAAPPYAVEAGTLPPYITPNGQSRLYFTVSPDPGKDLKLVEPFTIGLADIRGVRFIKDHLLSGRMRRGDDVHPHNLGILWSPAEGAESMNFTAALTIKAASGEGDPQEWTATYRISGDIPAPGIGHDEIMPAEFPAKAALKSWTAAAADPESLPLTLAAFFDPAGTNGSEGTLYLIFKVKSGYYWNNLASPPRVHLKTVSGLNPAKETILFAKHDGDGDSEDRYLALKCAPGSGLEKISVTAEANAWVCHSEEGWCRQFTAEFELKGKVK